MNEARIEKELDYKKTERYAKIAVLVIISVFAVMIDADKANVDANIGDGLRALAVLVRSELRDVEPAHVLTVVFLCWFYNKNLFREEHPFSKTSAVAGGILSAFLLLGMSFSATADFSFIAGRKCQFLIAACVFLGIWVILYACLKWLYEWMDRICVPSYHFSGILGFVDRHFTAVCIAVIFICWSILHLAYFPANVPYDGRYQLNQYFGITQLNTHHPYYATQIMGFLYSIGYAIGGEIAGCVVYVAVQSILAAVIFGIICGYIYKKSKSMVFALIGLLFYSIAPMWWTYTNTVMKDTLYFIAFAWFVLECTKLFLKDEGRFGTVRLIIAGVLLCILRNGTALIVIPAMIGLLLVVKEKRRILACALVFVLAMSYLLNTVVINYLGLTSDNQLESLTIPLMQIARWVTLYEDEVTEDEKEIINKVVQYDGIPDRYDPENSDQIKNRYRNTTDEQWDDFWKLWLEKLFEHPLVYIEAAMNQVYGYIDPFYYYTGLSAYPLYIQTPFGEADEDVEYSSYLTSENTRKTAYELTYTWNKVPGLSFVVCPGFYTWLGIILLGGLLRKKYIKETVLFIAPFMTVLICFASPVNGMLRYMLPVMAAMPLFVFIGIYPYLTGKAAVSFPDIGSDLDACKSRRSCATKKECQVIAEEENM